MLIALADLAWTTGLAAWLGFGGLGIPSLGQEGVALAYMLEAWVTASLLGLFVRIFNWLQSSRIHPSKNFCFLNGMF